MSKKQYPCLGSERRINGGKCVICGSDRADLRLDVEFNYMRGDDEVYSVHKHCIDDIPFNDVFKLLKSNIKIIGKEWQICYLRDDENRDALNQIVTDLKERIRKNNLSVGENFSIDRKDHSSAFELFEVVEVISYCNVVLRYCGGGS